MKKKQIQRELSLGDLNKEIEITKITQVNLSSGNEFIYLDQLNDGTWRICYTKGTLDKLGK